MELVERLRNAANWSDDGALLDEAADALVVRSSPSQVAPANPAQVTDAQIEHMVQQFLRWKLPDDFAPDGGILFAKVSNVATPYEYRHEPVGTNLFDYRQAKAMVQHMLDGLAAIGAGGQAVAYEPCGGCGEKNPDKRCIGCLHPFSALSQPHPADERTCTCHPDDNPPKLCSEKYALSECRKAADERVVEALRRMLRLFDDQGNLIADFAQMQGAISNGYQALSAKEGRS